MPPRLSPHPLEDRLDCLLRCLLRGEASPVIETTLHIVFGVLKVSLRCVHPVRASLQLTHLPHFTLTLVSVLNNPLRCSGSSQEDCVPTSKRWDNRNLLCRWFQYFIGIVKEEPLLTRSAFENRSDLLSHMALFILRKFRENREREDFNACFFGVWQVALAIAQLLETLL